MSTVQFNPAQSSYQANAQKFGNKNQAHAPKFGIIDGGIITCPAIACSCCAAPVAIPLLLLGLFLAGKGIKRVLGGAIGTVTGMFKKAAPAATQAAQ
jgi:hypothetical protein